MNQALGLPLVTLTDLFCLDRPVTIIMVESSARSLTSTIIFFKFSEQNFDESKLKPSFLVNL